MCSAIDETIKEIAVKHGVSISRDDPILILQTMNEQLLQQHRKSQHELLDTFKEEIEKISSQWKDDAKEKAERILNAALSASKSSLNEMLEKSVLNHSKVIQNEVSQAISNIRVMNDETRSISRINLFCCMAVLCFSIIFAIIMIY